jgi:starch synthase
MPPTKALFVTSELAGLAKAGGLGEVSAGLPAALRDRGLDVRILMPAYRDVVAKLPDVRWSGVLPGRAGIPPARLGEVRLSGGMPLYLVASPSLYDRRGTPYCTSEGGLERRIQRRSTQFYSPTELQRGAWK